MLDWMLTKVFNILRQCFSTTGACSGVWWYLQCLQTPATWHQDQQCNTTKSNRRLSLAGRGLACAFFVLENALLSTLMLLTVFITQRLAFQSQSNWRLHHHHWLPVVFVIGGQRNVVWRETKVENNFCKACYSRLSVGFLKISFILSHK